MPVPWRLPAESGAGFALWIPQWLRVPVRQAGARD